MRKNGDKTGAVNVGQLQVELQNCRRVTKAAEAKLKSAQDGRDRAKQREASAEQAFRDASRAVLG